MLIRASHINNYPGVTQSPRQPSQLSALARPAANHSLSDALDQNLVAFHSKKKVTHRRKESGLRFRDSLEPPSPSSHSEPPSQASPPPSAPSDPARLTERPPSPPNTRNDQQPETEMNSSRLNIVMVSPEVAPWSKVGGLGDVAKALPEALGKLGHRVMTVAPRYAMYPEVQDTGITFPLELPPAILRAQGPSWALARLYRASGNFGVERVFVDHPIFEPEKDLPPYMVYGAGYNAGDDDSDLDLRYSILCQAGLAAPVLLWEDLPSIQLDGGPSPSGSGMLGGWGAPSPGGARSPATRGRRDMRQSPSPSVSASGTDPDVAEERRRMLEKLEVLSVAVLGGTDTERPPISTGSMPASVAPAYAQGRPGPGGATTGSRAARPAGVTFVANDWATSLVPVRLRHAIQSGRMRAKYRWASAAYPSSSGRTSAAASVAATPDAGTSPFTAGSSGRLGGRLEQSLGDPAPEVAPNSPPSPAVEEGPKEREHALRLYELAGHLQSRLSDARVAFCIHNMAFQGTFSARSFYRLCLPPAALASMVYDRKLSGLVRKIAGSSAGRRGPGPAHAHSHSHSLSGGARLAEGADVESVASRLWALAHVPETPPNDDPASAVALNWLAAALRESDVAVTVSPGYAAELCIDSGGMGLADILRDRGVMGILNGLDTGEWDPANDVYLPYECRYSVDDVATGKAAAKKRLQEILGLKPDDTRPLIGFVGRLEDQKGVDVLLSALPAVVPREVKHVGPMVIPALTADDTSYPPPTPAFATGVADGAAGLLVPGGPDSGPIPQWVILGKGQKGLEALVASVGMAFPGDAVGIPAFDVGLSHLIMAGCDFLVVPSRFEPCGLVQLAAMRYGTVPIVSSVGGLRDSVPPSIGYHMGPVGSQDPEELCGAVTRLVLTLRRAIAEYSTPDFAERRRRAMLHEVSWNRSAFTWESCLRQLNADVDPSGAQASQSQQQNYAS